MENMPLDQELHHEIFGSILDRTEMTPFLLLPARDYASALKQVTKMMVNRGFDALGGDELGESERERATRYIRRAYASIFDGFFSFRDQAVGRAYRPALFERRTLPRLPERSYRRRERCCRTLLSGASWTRIPATSFCLPPPENIPTFFRGIRGTRSTFPRPGSRPLAAS